MKEMRSLPWFGCHGAPHALKTEDGGVARLDGEAGSVASRSRRTSAEATATTTTTTIKPGDEDAGPLPRLLRQTRLLSRTKVTSHGET